ncbi:MAG TPA: hypothetical protein VK917_00620, partial [Ilumatobacter sp.]|nr:hypothetical protein [Ilumatobacter sp.]
MMRRVIVIVMAVLSVLGAVATADRRSASADVTAPSPVRVLDTRTGTGAGVQQLVPGVVLRVAIDGIEPSGSTSVMLNLTGARAGDRGFVSAWSCDDPAPATSVLNVDVGRAVANSIVLPYTSSGLCFSSSVAVDLIADLTGIATDGDLQTGRSARLHDSRDGAPHRAGRTHRIPVAGRPGVDASASLALLNVTVARPTGDGWAIVQACGASSDASSMNFRAQEVVPHFTVSALGSGDICVTTSVDAHVIVDAFGWAAGSAPVKAVTPDRVLDTRSGVGGTIGPVRDGDVLRFRVAGHAGVPNDAAGAIVNVVAVRGAATGFVSIDPCDGSGATTSTINLWPGVLRANQAVLRLSASGDLCARVVVDDASTLHLVVDVVGYVDGDVSRPAPPSTTTPSTTAPTTTGRVATLPVGAALPSGEECASRVRPTAEIRPENAAPNANRGSRANANTSTAWTGFARVDGAFSGTTDEIIQWAACKWGIDEDIARAQLWTESTWLMSTNGDGGDSFGLGQVRVPYHGSRPSSGNSGAFENDNAVRSTAYNVDYTYAVWRGCFEGNYNWLA